MHRKNLYIAILGCCMMAAFNACVNDATPPQKELKFGDLTISTTIVVPIAGGTFYFNPKDIAHSAQITFPTNTYPTEKTVTLKTTPITGSTFGDNITPVSALYSFDAGGYFANNDITIDIPYTADTNNFTMAFFYDAVTFDLEGVPTLGYFPKLHPPVFSVVTRRSGSIFLSTIAKSKLGTAAASSFDPVKDNWEFPNYPTLITPAGQFAGQTLSSLWYYYEKTLKNSPHLYGNFDGDRGGKSPKVWEDNDLGLRVAAETQKNIAWDKNALPMNTQLNNGNILLTVEQVIYSMLVTGKPQIVTVVMDTTVLPLIVYKVINNMLFVADPNYPTITSGTITTTDNGFQTTTSASTGESIFMYATYIGVRAMIDWDAIGKTWDDAQNNLFTIFPKNTIGFKDVQGNLAPTQDGFATLQGSVTLNIQGSQPSFVKILQDGIFSLYDPAKGISLKSGANQIGICLQTFSADGRDNLWSGFYSFNIQEQTFVISPSIDSGFIENDITLRASLGHKPIGSFRYEWDMGDGSPVIKNTDIDSVRYRYKKTGTYTVALSIYQVSTNTLIGKETSTTIISLNPVIISPIGINGIANIPYVFYGIINLPKDITQRCEWTMGDGSPMVTITGFDTVQHTFQNAGTFTIKLTIFNNVTNALLGMAQGTISFTKTDLPTLTQLLEMKCASLTFFAKNSYKVVDEAIGVNSTTFIDDTTSINVSECGFTWNGSSFRISSSSSDRTVTKQIKGNFSSTLTTLSASCSWAYSIINAVQTSGGARSESIDNHMGFACDNIYLVKNTGDTLIFEQSGPYLQSMTSNIDNTQSDKSDFNSGPHIEKDYVSTYWNDRINVPKIRIVFWK